MPTRKRSALALLSLALLIGSPLGSAVGFAGQKPVASSPNPVADMEKITTAAFPPTGPGAAVIVVKDGKVLFRKGVGLANVEKNTPVKPDMVFRLGSITKQFTAVSILMLVEQGKIALDDDITKFLPDYPTKGKKITIEHLLTHTSGIKSYTSMAKWRPTMNTDLTVAQMIDVFKDEPLDFEPGTRFLYNNSGYFLLGAIIEKVSGKTYAEFIQERIFKPLGMTGSYYGTDEPRIPNRAAGHTKDGDKVVPAEPMSMTHPYAAGSIVSTVDDLAKWDAALYTEKLVKKTSLERAFTPYKLANGEATGYGYGWAKEDIQGSRAITHDGGINGFTTSGIRLPEERVYVAVLANSDEPATNPQFLAKKLAALVIGKPFKERTAIQVDPKVLEAYAGVYALPGGGTRIVTVENGKLYTQRSGGQKLEALAESETEFFYAATFSHFKFVRGADGKVTEMVMHQNGQEETASRTDKPLPKQRKAIQLDAKVFDAYVGEYELAPGFVLSVRREGERFITQATGQGPVEIFAESETEFFLKVVDAQLTFVKDDKGVVTQVILHQGGRDIPGKKK